MPVSGQPPAPRPWDLGTSPWLGLTAPVPGRTRLIISNDFSGNPDGLFQLAHHLVSPSVDVKAVIGSRVLGNDYFGVPDTSDQAVQAAKDLFKTMGVRDPGTIVKGARDGLANATQPQDSPGAWLIIAEAMRDDVVEPLVVVAGGGLTDIASAYMREPAIARRLTLVWVGGKGYDEPWSTGAETNFAADPIAAQIVFNASDLTVWQIPRDVYRRLMVSDTELKLRLMRAGHLGAYLYGKVWQVMGQAAASRPPCETYTLADLALVGVTALKAFHGDDTWSSPFETRPAPTVEADGMYRNNPDGRSIRVYTGLDTRLVLEDFFAKLEFFAQWQRGAAAG